MRNSFSSRRDRGQRAYRTGVFYESLVAFCYRLRGWRIVSRRWRNPYVEIDLVVATQRRFRCIEVKYRTNQATQHYLISDHDRKKLWQATLLAQNRFRHQHHNAELHVVIFGPKLFQWQAIPVTATEMIR